MKKKQSLGDVIVALYEESSRITSNKSFQTILVGAALTQMVRKHRLQTLGDRKRLILR